MPKSELKGRWKVLRCVGDEPSQEGQQHSQEFEQKRTCVDRWRPEICKVGTCSRATNACKRELWKQECARNCEASEPSALSEPVLACIRLRSIAIARRGANCRVAYPLRSIARARGRTREREGKRARARAGARVGAGETAKAGSVSSWSFERALD